MGTLCFSLNQNLKLLFIFLRVLSFKLNHTFSIAKIEIPVVFSILFVLGKVLIILVYICACQNIPIYTA